MGVKMSGKPAVQLKHFTRLSVVVSSQIQVPAILHTNSDDLGVTAGEPALGVDDAVP